MNKRILIVGASHGLGKVASLEFAKDGFVVTTLGRPTIDLAVPLTIEKKIFVNDYKDFDVILHCSGGGLGYKDPILSWKEFNLLMMVNLIGAAEINRQIIPRMIEKKKGTIIHTCSIASGEAVGSVGYNTVKAALAAYVRSLGRELAPHGVVVCGIAPGGFEAPGNAMERLKETNPEAYQEFLDNRLPRHIMGNAEELIPLLKFLASDDASMMGGCVVPIDAGEGHYYS